MQWRETLQRKSSLWCRFSLGGWPKAKYSSPSVGPSPLVLQGNVRSLSNVLIPWNLPGKDPFCPTPFFSLRGQYCLCLQAVDAYVLYSIFTIFLNHLCL